MAIEKGNSNAMFYLAVYYKNKKDYDNMIKYYLIATEKDNTSAICELGCFYEDQKD